jgi:hypothetical protein
MVVDTENATCQHCRLPIARVLRAWCTKWHHVSDDNTGIACRDGKTVAAPLVIDGDVTDRPAIDW